MEKALLFQILFHDQLHRHQALLGNVVDISALPSSRASKKTQDVLLTKLLKDLVGVFHMVSNLCQIKRGVSFQNTP